MLKPSRILTPTESSHHSDKAIRQGFQIAKQFDAEVFVIRVVQDLRECTVEC